MIYKKNLYEQVLDDLEKFFNHQTDITSNDSPDWSIVGSNFASYINSLRPTLHNFHKQINKYDGDTRMPYSQKEIQIVYVLRYFHAYWIQIHDALNAIYDYPYFNTFEEDKLKVALFCAGPAPELIGITRFLEGSELDFKSIEIHFFDEIRSWEFARKIFLFSNGKKDLLKKNFNMNFYTHDIDLTNSNDLEKFSTLNSFDVIVFQNCLNEFSNSRSESDSRSFLKVLELLSPECFAIFTDRNVPNTAKGFEMVEKYCSSKDYSLYQDDYHEFSALEDSPLPKILQNGNFFRDPVHSAAGVSAMGTNRYRTVIYQKHAKKVDSEAKTKKALNFKIGDSVIHSSLGKGTIKSTIKSVTDSTLALVVVFEEHSKPKTINLPCEEIKKIQNTY